MKFEKLISVDNFIVKIENNKASIFHQRATISIHNFHLKKKEPNSNYFSNIQMALFSKYYLFEYWIMEIDIYQEFSIITISITHILVN